MLFDVFEVQGVIEMPVAQGLEASNSIAALSVAVDKLLPEGFTLHGVNWGTATATARVRSKHGGPCREFKVYPMRRPNP